LEQIKLNRNRFTEICLINQFFLLNVSDNYIYERRPTPSMGDQGADPGVGDRTPLKPTKITLFTMILYHSENKIRGVYVPDDG